MSDIVQIALWTAFHRIHFPDRTSCQVCSSLCSRPVPANGVQFIANGNQLFALKEGAMSKAASAARMFFHQPWKLVRR